MTDPFSNQPPTAVDPDDFLMSGSGVSAKFPKVGHSYTGVVLNKRSEQQRGYDDNEPLFWDNGSPKMHVVVELQTDAQGTFDRKGNAEEVPDDDGVRNLFVKGNMQKAIRDAVRKSGASTLELFGKLIITYVGDGKQDNPRYNPPKIYRAEFFPKNRVPKNDPLLLKALESQMGPDDPFGSVD